MEISKENSDYLKSIEIAEKKKLKDAFFFQVAEIAGEFTILHVKDYYKQGGRYFIEACIMAKFKTEKEARAVLRAARQKIAHDFPTMR